MSEWGNLVCSNVDRFDLVSESKPAEVKHLSKRRKRERSYSLSSGERKGRSLNHIFNLLDIWGCKEVASGALLQIASGDFGVALDRGSQSQWLVRKRILERTAKEGKSPVFENPFVLLAILLKYLGERKPRGNHPGLPGKAKYLISPIVNQYREGKVKSSPVRTVK